MIWKIVLLLGVAVGVHGEEEAVSEQKVTIHHPKHAAIISHTEDKEENRKDHDWSYPSYEFSYKVKDPHTHDIKGQKEERDGDKVKGDYWLIEPTGRKRTVKYHANDEVGFNAHVDYTKTEYSGKDKDQNNQVEDRRLNSQEDNQPQAQKNGNGYDVTEGYNKEDQINTAINNRENGNNDEKGEIEDSGDLRGNIQEEDILRNQEEGNANINNNNQEAITDAQVTLEALNENVERQDNCRCNERRQNDYRTNINEVRNNNYGGQENTSRKKRKNVNRSINLKSGGNAEKPKHIEVEKNNNRKLSHSGEKKNNQNNNLNDKKKKNDSPIFGSRNSKRKQVETRDHNKYEDKSQNKTVKTEEMKETENIEENVNDQKYQHSILIHHPKIVVTTSNKKS